MAAHAERAHHAHHALRGGEAALGIDEEVGAGDDPLAGLESATHLDRVLEPVAELDLARVGVKTWQLVLDRAQCLQHLPG